MIASDHHWCIWGWTILRMNDPLLPWNFSWYRITLWTYFHVSKWGKLQFWYWVYLEVNNTTWHSSSFSHTQTYTKITCNCGSWSIEEQPNHQHITKHKHNQINEMFSWHQIMSRSINLNYASVLNNWIYILILHNNLTKQ